MLVEFKFFTKNDKNTKIINSHHTTNYNYIRYKSKAVTLFTCKKKIKRKINVCNSSVIIEQG